ncbi:hypothetical protein VTH06DRAFT_7945 [Thermothelomyces fergusii]
MESKRPTEASTTETRALRPTS